MCCFGHALSVLGECFKSFSGFLLYSILTVILLLTASLNSVAQRVVDVPLEEGVAAINLSRHLECASIARTDPNPQGSEENIDFSHVQQPSMLWALNDYDYLNHHFTDTVLWCRAALHNKNDNHYRWFFVLDNTRLNFVNFYWQGDDKDTTSIQKHFSGDHRQVSKQYSGMGLRTALPTFAITLLPGEKGHLYFAIDTDSVTWLTPKLYNSEAYGAKVNLRHLWQWLYAVMIMGCILLQLVLTRSSVGRTEAYYFLAVTSGLFYIYGFFGDSNIWLGIDSGESKNNMLYACIFAYQFFGLCFVTRHLRVKEFFPWLGRMFTLQSVLVLVCTILVFYGFESNQSRVLLTALCTLMSGGVILIGVCRALLHHLNWAWGLAISWLTIALSGVVSSLVFMGLMPFSPFTNKLILWAFPLDVIALSTSFVFQHYRYRKELQGLRTIISTQARKKKSASDVSVCATSEPQVTRNDEIHKKIDDESIAVTVPIVNDDVSDKPLNKGVNTEKRLQGIDCELKINLLMAYFERERAYCREDISLNLVSEVIGLRPDQTSALLNHKLGTSFSTFTNEYRVREAKRLLQEDVNESLINIAINSGFNSRANFNRVFKAHTQVSPAEFRKKEVLHSAF